MHLSDHDLKQLDEEVVRSLSADKLINLSVKLLADLKESRDRLNQDPDNSSRPPSSRLPWECGTSEEQSESQDQESEPEENRKENDEEAEEASDLEQASEEGGLASEKPALEEKKKGKPGKREGAPGYGRTLELPVTGERIHRPSECVICGESFSEDALFRAYTARYEVEIEKPCSGLAGIAVTQTKHVYGECLCRCGHWTREQPGRSAAEAGWTVELSEWHVAGPMLTALITSLCLRMRLSRARIQEFLHDWLGLYLSVATINQCIHEAGRAVEPVVENEILEAVRQAELVYADETGWKEHGQALWLWVFSCATATLFIVGRRTRKLVQHVLGDVFDGWLMSDGFWAYRDYDWRLRCLAHLIRKARGLEQSLDPQAHQFGTRALRVLETLIEAVYQARAGPPKVALSKQHAIRLGKFWAFCERHWDVEHKKTRELAREFLNDWDAIWAVLDYPWLPLTNNEAERALRHWVISRRISFGTRTAQGSRAFALLASVIETCRKRNVSPWPYIAEVISQRRKGHCAPALPHPAV